jgi:K+-transporting ATPase ATPase B chain
MAVTTTPQTGGEAPRAAQAERERVGGGLLDPKILWQSLPDAFKKLDPRVQPTGRVIGGVGAATTDHRVGLDRVFQLDDRGPGCGDGGVRQLAEDLAEGGGRAQAETLRRTKQPAWPGG